MPKAKLEFNLPEENSDFLLATRGLDFYSNLWSLDQEMRRILKHEHRFKTVEECVEHLRDIVDHDLFEGIE